MNQTKSFKWFKKIGLILSIIVSISLLFAYFLFQISKARNFQFFGTLMSHIETNQKVVALTFDDGPTPYTLEVLKILADLNVKATFYVIGQDLKAHPEIGQMIVDQGHELGNHSYTHPRFLMKSLAFVKDEIEKTNILIRKTGYTGQITFRPPYGKKLFSLPYYLDQKNITSVTWNIEPDTYFEGDADKIKQEVLKKVKPGSIILMHPNCPQGCAADREALPELIEALKTQGYKFVTIQEALAYDGTN